VSETPRIQCALWSCTALAPANAPLCVTHHELLPFKLRNEIAREFARRARGYPGAALRFEAGLRKAAELLNNHAKGKDR